MIIRFRKLIVLAIKVRRKKSKCNMKFQRKKYDKDNILELNETVIKNDGCISP